MDMTTLDMKTMAYIKSDSEFSRAKLYGFWRTLFNLVTGRRTSLLAFSDFVGNAQFQEATINCGLQDVPVEQIVGSVGRHADFTADFLPSAGDASCKDRWRKIYTLIATGHGIPPVELYKIGPQYFVLDGHHRVSVARHLGWQTIQAHVTEVPLWVLIKNGTYHQQVEEGKMFGSTKRSPVPILRLVLYEGEIARIPASYNALSVVSGKAWLTAGGRDKILAKRDRLDIETGSDDFALVSAIGNKPLVLEVQGQDSPNAAIMRLSPQKVGC